MERVNLSVDQLQSEGWASSVSFVQTTKRYLLCLPVKRAL